MTQQPVPHQPLPSQPAPNPSGSPFPTVADHTASPLPARGGARRLGPVPYVRALTERTHPWWKHLIVFLSLTLGTLMLVIALQTPVVVIEMITGNRAEGDMAMTPALMAVSLLALALYIPMTMLLQRGLYKVRPLSSVAGRMRWGLLAKSLLIMFVIYGLFMGGSIFLDDGPREPLDIGETVLYLAIIVLFVPFQAAGEEYAFRGLGQRVVVSIARRSRHAVLIGMVVSSLVFMVMHVSTDPWLNLYYFTMGFCFAIMAIVSGGLEVPIAVHVANNVVTFIIGILSGQSLDFDRSAGVGSAFMLIPMAFVMLVTLGVWLATRRKPHLRAPMMNRGPSGTPSPGVQEPR